MNGAISVGATSVILTDGTTFSSTGKGNIGGDSFQWTGKSTHTLTGVTGVNNDWPSTTSIHEGEFAHVLREICADLSAALYLEDESTFQRTDGEGMRANLLRERAIEYLRRLAHLGSVI